MVCKLFFCLLLSPGIYWHNRQTSLWSLLLSVTPSSTKSCSPWTGSLSMWLWWTYYSVVSRRPQYSSPLLEPVFFVRGSVTSSSTRITCWGWSASGQRRGFLLLIKIHILDYPWSKFISSHQGQYMNSILACCWIFSIAFQIPYLQHNSTAKRTSKETVGCLPTSICLSSPWSLIMKFTTYVSVSLDLIFITLAIILNGFIVNLLKRQGRKMQSAHLEHVAQAANIFLVLHFIYVVPWLCNDITWIGFILGLLNHSFENSILGGLAGVLSCIYYSFSSFVSVFGYRKVWQYLTEFCWCLVRNPSLSREWNCDSPKTLCVFSNIADRKVRMDFIKHLRETPGTFLEMSFGWCLEFSRFPSIFFSHLVLIVSHHQPDEQPNQKTNLANIRQWIQPQRCVTGNIPQKADFQRQSSR